MLVAAALLGLGVVVAGAAPARAAVAPVVQPPSSTVTADSLPTVQVDGVVWSQAVVGNTVYAGGRFASARPAGAAPGTQLTTRNNLLAYDIRTGALITSFAPDLNGQVLSVAASPDGKRLYVVGDFTTANGQPRRRVAAYDTATGTLAAAFNPPGVNSQARAVIATNDRVYVGGGFLGTGNGQLRNNLAAFSAANGSLLPWNPNADYTVWALAISTDGTNVFAGGSFQNVGGAPAYGLAKINAASGALDPSWAPEIRNAGKDAGITSLRVQGAFVYGTSYHFGAGGNLEGTFKVPVDSGSAVWLTDCHGDNYSSFMANGVVYTASHAHYCGNMGGGHPQYSAWKFQHAQAWSDTATGDILNDVHGYPNWHGIKQGPAIVNWLPDMAIGSVTGQYQAGWNVAGNDDYVVYGGEFPRVNGVGQQGLARFGRKPVAPGKEGPRLPNGSLLPTLVPTSESSVRVTWPAAYDRDDKTLTYKVVRGGVSTPRYNGTADSNWWTLPALGFVDTGLTPGARYTYQVAVSDPSGNVVNGATASITMPTTFAAATSYASAVRSNGARIYWPLNETSGLTATDRAAQPGSPANVGVTDGVGNTGVTWGRPGAVAGDSAASLGDNDWSRIYGNGTETAPDAFTTQVWINTTTTSGGRILGFSDLQDGTSGHRDRHLYMDNSGRLVFGVRAQDGSLSTVSSGRAYNDGTWHMVSASMGPQGMVLLVDGVRVGRRADTTRGEAYLGSWRLGGDNLDGWPSQPASRNFVGDVDEVAVYPTALTQDQVIAQYQASGRTATVAGSPADQLGAAVYADDPDLYWRLGDLAGTKAVDAGRGLNEGTYRNGVVLGDAGAVAVNAAARFDGNDDFVASDGQVSNPTTYSEEAWFKTTTNRGGKIIGFGDNPNGSSGSYDRHVYMQDDGKLVFGVWTGSPNVITTPSSFNDGEWHHVVATQSGSGMRLYLDGVLQGTNPQTAAQPYAGYWKVGGDNTWGSSSAYFSGTIDEVAVYSTELTPARVQAHYTAAGRALNQDPVAGFTSSASLRRATFDASASADPDGTISSYAWDFGDSTSGTGAQPVHVYPAAGTYDVKLTVTDNKGATSSVSHPVTVSAPPVPADSYGAAVVSDSPRLYWRLGETSGNVARDVAGAGTDGTYFNGYTLGQAGALPIPDGSVRFDGNQGFVSSNDPSDPPSTYSEEAWFNTTTTRGGKIIGFGSERGGSSNHYDRHVYMQDDGHLVFGTYTGQLNTITTPASYNNGQWHHVVATQSSSGMRLYVDGQQVGTNPQTGAESYTGYWKVGGDNTWGSSSAYFDGLVDEVAVYPTELSAARVEAHYAAAQPAPNRAPTAAFSTSTTNLAVDVDASASTDPDGSVVGYRWDFGDGWTGTGRTASHSYAKAGTYQVVLEVTDDDGSTGTVSHAVTVQAANLPPQAKFTAAASDLDVALDAAASVDPDGKIVSYAWDFGDTTTGTGASLTHRFADAGSYVVTLTVTDAAGATDTATTTVTVTRPANVAPVARFTSAASGLRIDLDASTSSDDDGTVADYRWDFGDGSSGTGKTVQHTFASKGSFTVKLTVTDDDGATASTSQAVVVAPANQSPTAVFEPTTANLKVDVDASGSADADGSITAYAWDFGDGGKGTGVTASHAYAAAGTYTITLKVTDNDGATTTTSKPVTVASAANQSPVASFTSTTDKLTAAFDGRGSSDPDGSIVGYSWDFGDGASGSGATTSHAYPAGGTYTVTLTVTDDKGATNKATSPVVVTGPPVVAGDAFERTVTNAWGTADTGGSWTTGSTTSNYNVVNGAGTMKMAAGSGPSAYLNAVSAANVDLTTSVRYDKAGGAGATYTSLVARRIGSSDYRAKIQVTATGTTLSLVRVLNGAETTLSSQAVPGMVVGANEVVNLRLQVEGNQPTTLRAKVWKAGTQEPSTWRLSSTDSTAALQAPGAVGLYSYLSGSANNAPVTVGVLDFSVLRLG